MTTIELKLLQKLEERLEFIEGKLDRLEEQLEETIEKLGNLNLYRDDDIRDGYQGGH